MLSYRSAAMHWGMLNPAKGPVDVTVPGTGGRSRRRGIRLHRSRNMTKRPATIRHGIPTTSPARPIRDLRRVMDRAGLRRAIAKAEVLRLPVGNLDGYSHEPTRSELERRFLSLCRRHGLPRPEVNVRVGPYEVDFLWREPKVIVETDGFATHGGRVAFARDRERDGGLRVMGYSVQRFAYRHVVDQGAFVASVVRALLGVGRDSA